MKAAEINRTFLAKDVYRQWRKIIRGAETDITVFTPYFDKTLLTLLRANLAIAHDQIVIVTDITPENALEMPYQLRAAKRAISSGISVRSLDGLHAKVLLIDQSQACIGSQNFTTRGRKNKEATVSPAISLGDSEFVRQLQAWLDASRELSVEEIDEMLSELSPLLRKHKKLHDAIAQRVTAVRAGQEQRREVFRTHLHELEQESTIHLAQERIFARLRTKNGYESLGVMNLRQDDLTDWVIRLPDQSTKPYAFERLFMYPIILADSNRMGFARLGKRGITYVRAAVNWSEHRPWIVGGVQSSVSMRFPDTETERRNIVVALKTNEYHGSCTFEVLVNGKKAVVKGQTFQKGRYATQSNFQRFVINAKKTLKSETARGDFFAQFLKEFRFSVLRIDNKNASKFFEDCWYKVSVVQVYERPLLVFSRHQ